MPRPRWAPMVAFGVLAVALLAAPLISLVADERASAQRTILRQHSTPVTVAAHDLERTVLQLAREAGRFALDDDPKVFERLNADGIAVDDSLEALIAAARDTMFQDAAAVASARARAVAVNVRQGVNEILDGNQEAGELVFTEAGTSLLDAFLSSVGTLSDEAEGDLQTRPAAVERIERVGLIAQTSAAALGALGLVAVVWLVRSRESLLGHVEAQQDRFIALVGSIGLGVFEVNRDGAITYMNPVGAVLLGYQPGELNGCPAYQMLHQTRMDGAPIAPEDSWVHFSRATTRPFNGEDALARKDGALLPVDVVSRPIGPRRRRTGAVVAFRDISAQLKQRQMREDFIALASHELRSPLTSAQGFALWLDRRVQQRPEAFDDETREAITTIRSSTERLSSTLRLFSQLAAIEAGQFVPESEPVSLVPLVRDEVVAFRARHPGVSVAELFPEESITIASDEDRIAEIVNNLLENAARHGGSQVVVRVAVEIAQDEVRLRVGDDGPGVPADLRARVFERHRGHRHSGGMGLGLYISHEIARRLGGELRLEGDAGAEFVLTLPRSNPGTNQG